MEVTNLRGQLNHGLTHKPIRGVRDAEKQNYTTVQGGRIFLKRISYLNSRGDSTMEVTNFRGQLNHDLTYKPIRGVREAEKRNFKTVLGGRIFRKSISYLNSRADSTMEVTNLRGQLNHGLTHKPIRGVCEAENINYTTVQGGRIFLKQCAPVTFHRTHASLRPVKLPI